MLDRYWYGPTTRISPEAPVPVVHVQDMEERPGGAGNVALNIAALGARAVLAGVAGDDEAADNLQALLEAHRVECRLQRRAGRATSTKLRVMSRHQQLIRLDFEDPPAQGSLRHAQELDELMRPAGAVVISDYGKGAVAEPGSLIVAAARLGIPVLVDPKGRDFSPYRGASLVTPNLAEFEAVAGTCHDLDDLVTRGLALCRDLDLGGLLVTRSEHGMTLVRPGEAPVHLPARAREVFDVTGAGDTVIAVMAAALAAGETWTGAMQLANLAAGLVVGKLGTASVTVAELEAASRQALTTPSGVMDEARLIEAVAAAQARGERIVMTNGCFDILHAGHVRYLAQARRLGDRLVVAVNDDASVQRLKGHDRPINTLDRRMDVLEALASVDWVVPFAEDTPRRLICAVGPDVLVKGGDYQPEQIAGGDCVRKRGGQVTVLDYEHGCSTTEIINALQSGSKERGAEQA